MGFFDSIYLERYADLLLRFGVKLEKGQVLLLELPQEQVEFTEAIRKAALMMGAGDVIIFHNDIHTELACLKATAKNGKMTVPSEQAAVMQKCLAENGASLSLMSPYPRTMTMLSDEERRLSFENGRVCRFDAKEGLDILREIVEHDEGSAYLGEIAFLETGLPIAQTKRLFYNTLLDENASCHIALGMGFPGNIRGIDPRDEETAKACDVNFSAYHVDIMFGTEDVCAEGICVDGKIVSIMQNGKFVL